MDLKICNWIEAQPKAEKFCYDAPDEMRNCMFDVNAKFENPTERLLFELKFKVMWNAYHKSASVFELLKKEFVMSVTKPPVRPVTPAPSQ